MIFTKIRTYSELIKLHTFEERFRYLKLDGKVAEETFGFDRWINQTFYRSKEWRDIIRPRVIVRDNACDLGVKDYDISGPIIIHHMNPISVDDIVNATDYVFNLEYLVCTVLSTHNAIHYGNPKLLSELPLYPTERKPNDTCPWKR